MNVQETERLSGLEGRQGTTSLMLGDLVINRCLATTHHLFCPLTPFFFLSLSFSFPLFVSHPWILPSSWSTALLLSLPSHHPLQSPERLPQRSPLQMHQVMEGTQDWRGHAGRRNRNVMEGEETIWRPFFTDVLNWNPYLEKWKNKVWTCDTGSADGSCSQVDETHRKTEQLAIRDCE